MRFLGTTGRQLPIHDGLLALTASLFLALLVVAAPAIAQERDKPQDKNVEKTLQRIGHIIVIYQENWSFDSLYGQFPGADGLANGFDTLPQKDRSAAPPYSSLIYTTPSPLNGGVDPQFPSVGGQLALSATQLLPLPLIPYDFTTYIAPSAKTGDIIHRFYHEQLQIDNGALEAKLGNLGRRSSGSHDRHLSVRPERRHRQSRVRDGVDLEIHRAPVQSGAALRARCGPGGQRPHDRVGPRRGRRLRAH